MFIYTCDYPPFFFFFLKALKVSSRWTMAYYINSSYCWCVESQLLIFDPFSPPVPTIFRTQILFNFSRVYKEPPNYRLFAAYTARRLKTVYIGAQTSRRNLYWPFRTIHNTHEEGYVSFHQKTYYVKCLIKPDTHKKRMHYIFQWADVSF